MRATRNTIWLIPLAIIITYPLWSIPTGKFLAPRGNFDEKKAEQAETKQVFTMQDVKIIQNEQGHKSAEIVAKHARSDEDPNILILDDVNADLFDNNNEVTNIVAKQGDYNMATKMLTLIENVVVDKVKDKQQLYTELLHYDNIKNTVNCPGPTKIKGEDFEVDGGNLFYDIKTRSYILANRVSCNIRGFIQP
jgi:LPS export ABC transporter protein LptC